MYYYRERERVRVRGELRWDETLQCVQSEREKAKDYEIKEDIDRWDGGIWY